MLAREYESRTGDSRTEHLLIIDAHGVWKHEGQRVGDRWTTSEEDALGGMAGAAINGRPFTWRGQRYRIAWRAWRNTGGIGRNQRRERSGTCEPL